jgi:hypothetical protein
VDRRFNRSKFDADRVAEEFGKRLVDAVDPQEVADDLTDVLVGTFEPKVLGVWMHH